jgi:hypothetical protein
LFSEKADKIPILDLGKRCGTTGYIDFVRTTEIKHPIVKGIDCYSRPFIVITVISFENKIMYMETFFQRYIDDPSVWMGAGHGDIFMTTYGGMTYQHFELLKKLIDDQTCKISYRKLVLMVSLND